MDIRENVKAFCRVLKEFPVFSKTIESNDSITVQIEPWAQVEFYKSGSILALIEIPEIEYFHAWALLPCLQDYKEASKKISSAIQEFKPESNRSLNASVK